jgi:mRNA interferase MazF
MNPIERGQIFRVNLEPAKGSEQQGTARPCVVLTITPFNKKFRTVGVVPLSSSARPFPPVVVSTPSAGLQDSVALCYQLRTVDKSRLGKLLGAVSAQDMTAIEDGVRQVYGL